LFLSNIYLQDYRIRLGFFGVPREVDTSKRGLYPKSFMIYKAPELFNYIPPHYKSDIW
jgi:hypothetical protein